ncbi:hypothetical protein D3C85_1478370 [compost metagenome]
MGVEGVVAALAGPVEQFHQAGRRDVGDDAAGSLELLGQVFQPGGVELGQVGAGVAGVGNADFDLAASQVGGQQFAQGRFHVTQFVGQPEVQVEEAAVDAAQFKRKRALF